MVLSLTTEADGKEPEYAAPVAEEPGAPAVDGKVRPGDENGLGPGHGFNTSPSPGTPAAIASATGKILAKAQLLAEVDLGTDGVKWGDGAFTVPGGQSRSIAD